MIPSGNSPNSKRYTESLHAGYGGEAQSGAGGRWEQQAANVREEEAVGSRVGGRHSRVSFESAVGPGLLEQHLKGIANNDRGDGAGEGEQAGGVEAADRKTPEGGAR